MGNNEPFGLRILIATVLFDVCRRRLLRRAGGKLLSFASARQPTTLLSARLTLLVFAFGYLPDA